MTLPPLNSLSIQAVANKLATRELSITELLQACLQQIELREPQVRAWTYLDIDHAKKQTAKLERVFRNISERGNTNFPGPQSPNVAEPPIR